MIGDLSAMRRRENNDDIPLSKPVYIPFQHPKGLDIQASSRGKEGTRGAANGLRPQKLRGTQTQDPL